ncbi:MAG: hypothetical protein RLZZ384_1431 [Pseudomonadota bacterium]|jgi:hypothetical protein
MLFLHQNVVQPLMRNLRMAIAVFTFVHFIPAHADSDGIDRELTIKIAYLYHFAQFTQWANPLSTLNYCVFNDATISELLKTTLIGKKSNGTVKLAVHAITEQDDINRCEIIFFPHAVSKEILNTTYHKPILTVGVQKDFTQHGGIIYLFEEDQKIRFFINHIDAQESNLNINSQLLALSRLPPA